MIGAHDSENAAARLWQGWDALPMVVRWGTLLALFALTCVLTGVLRWGQLPATPFYPVVLLSIMAGTERQGYVLTALCVGASLALTFLLPLRAFYAQQGSDSALLALVGGVLIVAMRQRRSTARLVRAIQYETGVIRALGNYALTRLTRDEMMRIIARYLATYTDAASALVAMSDATQETLVGYQDNNGTGSGPRRVTRSVADTLAGDVFTTGLTRVLGNAENEPRFVPSDEVLLRSVIATPLLLAGQPIGVLLVGKERAYAFGDADVQLVETLARSIAVPLYASRPARTRSKVAPVTAPQP